MDSDQTLHTHQQILRILRRRLADALRVDESEIPAEGVGDLTNALFLLHGQFGCLGDYNVTIRALYALLGDLLWAEPEAMSEGENAVPVVN